MKPTQRDNGKLAYKDDAFLDSDEARPLRILAEYLDPLYSFRREHVQETIVFFGSARLSPEGPLGRYYEEARELARLVTTWSKGLASHRHRYIVCSGGGGGIMEAANRGASEAGGKTVGLNIGLPHEQRPNPYVTRELCFEFHYFFMRKLWFAHLARALVVFPGGFGTLDELTEILTLEQTRKLDRKIPILLYGSSYWREVIDFEALARHGMIDGADLELFQYVDDPATALDFLRARLEPTREEALPAFAKSRTPRQPGEG
ncbi:MAG TPA: TIGR00730 family Rossman fold protein [Anaeromyxobacteraceae bacterium]|nr:TIGR00730 family Rossman fold protein [Anaeromyxobacteraceae bacterium]